MFLLFSLFFQKHFFLFTTSFNVLHLSIWGKKKFITVNWSFFKGIPFCLNSLLNNNILGLSKSKAFADDKMKVTENLKFVV